MVMRDQIEEVLFEVRSRRANRMDLVLPDHLRKRKTEFGRAHRTRHRQKHLPALCNVPAIGFRGIHHDSGIEVTKIVSDKLVNFHRRWHHFIFFSEKNFSTNPRRTVCELQANSCASIGIRESSILAGICMRSISSRLRKKIWPPRTPLDYTGVLIGKPRSRWRRPYEGP